MVEGFKLPLDLLPRLLDLSTADIANHTIDRILSLHWSKAVLVKFVSLLRDFPVSVRSRADEFLERVFRGLGEVDLQDLPSVVYQLLLLASKGFGRKAAVGGVLGFFGRGRRGRRRRARRSCGRWRGRNCKWLPDSLKGECLQSAKRVEKALMKAVNESNCGREHVIPSIVQLGFVLLESAGGDDIEKFDVSEGLMGDEELGIQILKILFDVHDMARNEIIQQCRFRILSLKPQQSIPIMRLLECLVRNYTYPMLEYVARLKELLDYFTVMHDKTAMALFTSLLPLMKFSRDLQDYTILVMRKAMFRKEDAVHLAATNAIIELILLESKSKKTAHISMRESSSQASSSQQTDMPSMGERNLFHELSGLLRRCLSQQAKAKEVLYHGLLKLVVLDPCAAGLVFDLLWSHFLHFYKEDASSPLTLRGCVRSESGRISIEEPLDSLSQDGDGEESAGYLAWILSGILEVLINVITTELEKAADLEKNGLEKELLEFVDLHDFVEKESCINKVRSSSKKGSLRNTVQDILDKSNSNSKVCSRADQKISLSRKPFLAASSIRQLLMISLKLSNVDVPGTQKSSQNQSQPSSCKASTHSSKMMHFVLKSCLQLLKSFPSMGNTNLLKTLFYGDIKLFGQPLIKLVLALKSGSKSKKDQPKKGTKGRRGVDNKGEELHLALSCLNELIKIISCGPHFAEFIEDLISTASSEWVKSGEGTEVSDDELGVVLDDDCTRNMHFLIIKILQPFLSELLPFSCEAEVLSDIILTIGNKLPCNLRNFHGAWVLRICRSTTVENPRATQSVVSLAIYLTSPPNDLVIAQEITLELLKVIGSDDNEPIKSSEIYPIINNSTASGIASMLLQLIESIIVDLEWALLKLKSLSTTNHIINDLEKSDEIREEPPVLILEESLYARSEALVTMLSSFAEMSLKDPQAEQLLKLTTRFYKLLARMTKLCIAPKGSKQLYPGQKFQRLAEVTCKRLTAPLYNFVAVMQNNQQANAQGRGVVGKIKRENKCIPELVFQIEDYERYLIQLSKLTKVNLLRHAKRSTARDFKILEPKKVTVPENMPEHEPSQANSTASQNESGGESDVEEDKRPGEGVLSDSSEGGIAALDSEPDEGEIIKTKKAKKAQIIEDSDEEV
ncbi:hypothetical protein QJS10_CPA05g00363 [Acorus calamus]|uniref:Fanconi anemia group I protein n=1 Tax=Acorus calamus TaxID=4465 RepID=A0AAV9EQU9_ACOCL|nr:hypothetical protein QJS10_CPA05g00363 [Acorus calamus]